MILLYIKGSNQQNIFAIPFAIQKRIPMKDSPLRLLDECRDQALPLHCLASPVAVHS